MQVVESWGRFPKTESKVRPLFWASEAPRVLAESKAPVLTHGLGRSYGDCCLNDGGVLLATRHMNRFIDFDASSGSLTCDAGVSLAQILDFAVPRGWFPPVTPGTKFVTVGGAVANDVHGKNHHRAGTFGRHVTRLCLLQSDGRVRECSPTHHAELFRATIGGLGLTGLILWVEFTMRPVSSPWMDAEFISFRDLDTFFELTEGSDQTHEHTVSWVDLSATGKHLGRGIFIRGNHAESRPSRAARQPKRQRNIPFDAPSWLLNRWSINLFNRLYFHQQKFSKRRRLVHYDAFFYPLDAIGHWNRLYGKRGFFQYQCVVPEESAIRKLLQAAQKTGLTSFLSVLKRFGDRPSPGLLSFPRPGFTLTLDIPYSPRVSETLDQLDQLVADHGGAIYPAKDAFMAASMFDAFFPQWRHFAAYRDPAFSSSFWRRVTSA